MRLLTAAYINIYDSKKYNDDDGDMMMTRPVGSRIYICLMMPITDDDGI